MINKKQKLTDAVGKAVHQHVNRVKEASHDFVVLYLRRSGVAIDPDHLGIVLKVFKDAIDSEHMNKLDQLMNELDKDLGEFIEE